MSKLIVEITVKGLKGSERTLTLEKVRDLLENNDFNPENIIFRDTFDTLKMSKKLEVKPSTGGPVE